MNLVVGYSPFSHPLNDGMGPFGALFNKSVDLKNVDSLKGIDAVLLWGGEDISPMLYAEERYINSGPEWPSSRDLFELELCREAHKAGKPIIGVCRGAQFICVFAGGKLIQHVSGHSTGHMINTYDKQRFHVTSSHHQMLYPFDVQHEMLATSEDKLSSVYKGIPNEKEFKEGELPEPEVVYFPEVNGFAIQCHPEWHLMAHPFNVWAMDQIKLNCFCAEIEA